MRPGRVLEELGHQARRARRWLWRRRHLDVAAPRRALFVVGCQRSGTNMLMWTLERAPEAWVYHEHVFSPAFRNYRLRPDARIEALVRRSPAPAVVFKPVCDAHLTDRLLERHAGSRAIWIFRHYADVANSAVRNFGTHLRDIMDWLVRGDAERLDWRGERVPPDALELVKSVWRPELPLAEAGALFWYLRNRFFFDLGLDADPRVLLVRYEDLVGPGGEAEFQRVFDFAGCSFDPAAAADVFGSSVGKHEFPGVDERVTAACRELEARLVAARAAQGASGPG